jgi:FtsP/CotA-like multicopper oxidase with cupredoxin domain
MQRTAKAALVLALMMALLAGCAAKPAITAPAEKKLSADEMDSMEKQVVAQFPAKTEGKGNQLLTAELDGNVKVFRLTVSKIKWETSPGIKPDAYAYNGMIPGPTIRVTEGDKLRVVVDNKLPDESTTVHWHGLMLENKADGVPFITQDPIKPGQIYTYEFTAANAGTHMYHSHMNAVAQVTGGLLGALIVDPKNPADQHKYGESQDIVMVLNDGILGLTLNGKSFPATVPIVAALGEKVRVRFMNEGQMIHPMHLHGMPFTVVEKDGYPCPSPSRRIRSTWHRASGMM